MCVFGMRLWGGQGSAKHECLSSFLLPTPTDVDFHHISISSPEQVRVWGAMTGELRLLLKGHDGGEGCICNEEFEDIDPRCTVPEGRNVFYFLFFSGGWVGWLGFGLILILGEGQFLFVWFKLSPLSFLLYECHLLSSRWRGTKAVCRHSPCRVCCPLHRYFSSSSLPVLKVSQRSNPGEYV